MRTGRRSTRLTGLVAAFALMLPAGATPSAQGIPDTGPLAQEPYACRQDTHKWSGDSLPIFAHVASLVEADNGDIIFAFQASLDPVPDAPWYPRPERQQRTALARLPAEEHEFAELHVIPNDSISPEYSRVQWSNEAGLLFHFFSIGMGPDLADWTLDVRTSEDNGETWSEPRVMREELGWMFGTRPFRMSNGEVLLPVYQESSPYGVGFIISSDDFETWEVHPPENEVLWPKFVIQATTVELDEPGHLLAYLRPRSLLSGRIYQTRSFDYGRTWTPALPTGLPNPDSRSALLALDSGNLLLAYNPTSSSPRTPLRLALSEDGGVSWPYIVDVEDHPEGRFDYPDLIQSSDGFIHLGYTHWRLNMRHVVFNEQYVREGADMASDSVAWPASDDNLMVFSRTEYRDGELRTVDACAYSPQAREQS